MQSRGPASPTARAAVLSLMVLLTGCVSQDPRRLAAPGDTVQLWAVVPFENESGVSIVDGPSVADAFMREAQHVPGIDVVPVNRVIRTMSKIGLERISSYGDARTLMSVMELDGLIVGSVTAYDPYRPMTLGMAIELYVRSRTDHWNGLDVQELGTATSGHETDELTAPFGPVAQAAGVFDASNHRTLRWLEDYAKGRTEPGGPFGSEIYQVSMDRYTNFVCYRLLRHLLAQEHFRLSSPVARQES